MKKTLVTLVAISMFALAGTAFSADAPEQNKPATVIKKAKIEEHAIVKEIDYKTRIVTLSLANGSTITMAVDPKVKRFDKVQVGDTVKAKYSEAVTVKLRKTKTDSALKVEESVTAKSESAKPAGKAERNITIVATIEKISDDFRTVTLKGADGKLEDVSVRNPDNYKSLKSGAVKVGDQIDITYRQAFAISVEKEEVKK